MSTDTKIIGGTVIATILILVGGVFFFSRSQPPAASGGPKVDSSLLVRPDSDIESSSSAKVTLVEFGDFQCPACGSYHPLVKQLTGEFKNDLTFVFRNFPLQQHKNALPAAYSAEAAGLQHKYWEMHDMIYENQSQWSEADNAQDIFAGYAQKLGLNLEQFKKDLSTDSIKQKVDRDLQDGNTVGVNATPTFFLDSEKLENPSSYDDFKTLVKAAILKSPITQAPVEKYHAHFDFKVIINGKALDFAQAKYQSVDKKDLDEWIHFHNSNGNIVHIHKRGIKLGEFINSLKMNLTSTCFTLDTGEKFCNQGGSTLKMFVNGKENNQYDQYVPQDIDRLLISFGSDSQKALQAQIDSVTDNACMYSLKCPERGKPPTENCVGGLGTDCTD